MAGLHPRALAPTHLFALAAASLLWFGCSPDAGDSPTEPAAEPAAELARGGTPGPPQELGPALAAQKRHGPALMRLEGVVGHGVGLGPDGEAGITVYTLRPGVGGISSRLDGVPVRTVATGMFVAGTTDRVRPAPNGWSVGHPDITAGTLGAVVRGSDDVCYVLSNNHVLANSNDASIGDAALQPGPVDGGSDPDDAIGTLSAFEPIAFDGSDNTIDAAIAEVFTPVSDFVTGSTPGNAYGAPGTSVQEASVGLPVQKFGRTTELREGTVEEINVTVNVCYACSGPFCFRCTQLATFTDQMGISSPDGFSSGGDSGSLIVTNDGSANPVGLLFAGSSTRTLGNPIGAVLTRFGVSVTADLGSCAGGDGDGNGDEDENQAPTASFAAAPTSGDAPLDVSFDASASDDPDGDGLTYSWNFGDGATANGEMVDHTYTDAGEFTVTLTVSDGELTDDATATIDVSTSDDPGDEPGDGSAMHVADLDGSSDNNGSTWTANVSILVEDDTGSAVEGAAVSGSWNGGASGAGSCTTGQDGRCSVSQAGIHKRNASATFTVSGVSHADLTYDATANTDPDGDSDGTSITVSKP